jgi:hypothetical protein
MIVADVNVMLKNGIGKEYEYLGHQWINEQLSCGCISALCTSITEIEEDRREVSKKFTKINNLQSFIKECAGSDDPKFKERFDKFSNEIVEIRQELNEFMIKKREQYHLPRSADFNSDLFSVKLRTGETCKGIL